MNSRVTELGKALRRLRVDLELPMAKMAEISKFSTSYLSAVELGKKKLADPVSFVEALAAAFSLTKEKKDELYDLALGASDSVPIPLDDENGQMMLGFARVIRNTQSKEDFEILKGLLDDFENKKMGT